MPYSFEDEARKRKIKNYLMGKYNPMLKTPGTDLEGNPLDENITVNQDPSGMDNVSHETPSGLAENKPAAAIDKVPDYFDTEARSKYKADVENKGQLGYIGAGFAGLGDAMSRSAGASTNFLDTSLAAIKGDKTEKMADYDQTAERKFKLDEYMKKVKEERAAKDPNSPENVAAREAYGLPLPKTTTAGMIPLAVEGFKALTERIKAEGDNAAKDKLNSMKPEDFLDRYGKDTTKYKDTALAYDRLRIGLKQGNKQGDLAMLYAYINLINPGLGVREGAAMNAAQIDSLPDIIKGMYLKVSGKGMLNDDERAKMHESGKAIHDNSQKNYKKDLEYYKNIQRENAIDPKKFAIQEYGPTVEGTSGGQFEPDVLAYAEKYKITPEQAQQTKDKRTGKKG